MPAATPAQASGIVYASGAAINPAVPYQESVSLQYGDTIYISGFVPQRCNRFRIDLLQDSEKSIVLHVDSRVKDGEILRNTLGSGGWGKEERTNTLCGMAPGHPFTYTLHVTTHCYKIGFNGFHLNDFMHRASYKSVKALRVAGDVQLHSVKVQHLYRDRQPGQSMPPLPWYWTKEHTQELVGPGDNPPSLPCGYNLEVPYVVSVAGGLRANRVIYLTLIPHTIGHSMKISFSCGTTAGVDAGFILRANYDKKSMELLDRVKGSEGTPLIARCHFPLKKGVHCDMMIRRMDKNILVYANTDFLAAFPLRLADPSLCEVFEVTGDTELLHVRML